MSSMRRDRMSLYRARHAGPQTIPDADWPHGTRNGSNQAAEPAPLRRRGDGVRGEAIGHEGLLRLTATKAVQHIAEGSLSAETYASTLLAQAGRMSFLNTIINMRFRCPARSSACAWTCHGAEDRRWAGWPGFRCW